MIHHAIFGFGSFRTYGTRLMMSADWSKDDNPSLRRYFRMPPSDF